ncbi:MAG: Lrp/AsnC ligand binding domain-containing protein, partial [Candidatus Hodarchaeota archaeon]
KSYFKKYQIIETIKVYKTNGISLRKSKLSYEEDLMDNLKDMFHKHEIDESEKIIVNIPEKIDLDQIDQQIQDIEYNPKRFPGLIIKVENSSVKIMIFSNGKIIITGLKNIANKNQIINKIIESIKKTGIKLDKENFEENYEIDNIDYMILIILRDNQGPKPISTYEIRKILKDQYNKEISQSTIHNRIKKLEKNGVILNYAINFCPKKIGFKGKYLLRIKPKDPSKYNELALQLDMNKNITHLFRIGEQFGLFAIVRVKKIEEYANFIKDLYTSEEIEDTFTNFVLDELIPFNNFVLY